MSRDYAAEMRAVIDAEAQGTYAPPVVAAQIVEKLRATDRDLLAGWLDSQAVNFVRDAINLRDCSTRTHNRAVASRSVFAKAAAAAEAGDDGELRTRFLDEPYPVGDGLKIPLRDMKAADLSMAADNCASRAKDHLLREAFLRAVARKVGRRSVGEVFDEDRLAKMWRSIVGDSE